MTSNGEPRWIEMVVDHNQLPLLVSERSVCVRDAKGTWCEIKKATNRTKGYSSKTELQINVGGGLIRYITLYGMNPLCLVQLDAS